MRQIDAVVSMLNEAVTLSPGLWSLFDVQVPCLSMVGRVTPIELMAVDSSDFAFANALGLINGALCDTDHRISIIVENVSGSPQRKFIATRISQGTSRVDGPSTEIHAQEDGPQRT
jgi:hypothetical protein